MKFLKFLITIFLITSLGISLVSAASVRLHVFTSEGQNKTFDAVYDINQTISSVCNSSKTLVKLITHGFAETWNMNYRWNWVSVLKKELFQSIDSTKLCVIAVDWKELAYGGDVIANYWNAISNMKIAAELMSEFLNKSKIHERDVHCIGFSLGAHMCSIFYKTYIKKYNIKLNRITGLDPAGPLFGSKPVSEKLHFSDADFVDIIHTSNDLGLSERNGHMDFYPDNGPNKLKPCDIDKRLQNIDENEKVILFEEDSKGKNYENVVLDDNNISLNDLYNSTVNSIVDKFKSFFDYIKSFFITKPKRLFIRAHQFFGCAHLMAVRYFIYSINDCIYKADYCPYKNLTSDKELCIKLGVDNRSKEELLNGFPRMGYWASKSALFYKQSQGIFFVMNMTESAPYCHDKTSNYLFESKNTTRKNSL